MTPGILLIGAREVRELLSMERCMEAVADALTALARDEAQNPLRSVLRLPGGGLLGTMPGAIDPAGVAGVKAITVMLDGQGGAAPSHQGLVLLFDAASGRPLAVLEGGALTALRTAAASGVATRLLAREDARSLALLGAGVQAATHLEAMRLVRPIDWVRVWSRTATHAARFAARESARHGIAVEPVASPREAVSGADLVCTLTAARAPVLEGGWLAPGVHVNAVGACTPAARELDAEAVARARVYVDRRESALHEAGDLLLAIGEGRVDASCIVGEIGEVLAGRVAGRRSAHEVTLFESLGLAVEDLAAARVVHDEARRRGSGSTVDLG